LIISRLPFLKFFHARKSNPEFFREMADPFPYFGALNILRQVNPSMTRNRPGGMARNTVIFSTKYSLHPIHFLGGWQFINWETGHVDVHYQLPNNVDRTVAFNRKTGRPEDAKYQDSQKRIPPQKHF
jgi:hypothetical protein